MGVDVELIAEGDGAQVAEGIDSVACLRGGFLEQVGGELRVDWAQENVAGIKRVAIRGLRGPNP
jgi:hypothetical protein